MELPESGAFQLPIKCLQIGIGGYIRGHADFFLDQLGYGRIIAVQPNSVEVPQLLHQQDGLYTLISVGGTDEAPDYEFRIISSIAHAFAARTQWDKAMACVSSTPLELIMQVVTENGIKVDTSDARCDGVPKSAIGKLTQILYEQWRHFPETYITVLDTDNVSDNGRVARESVYTMVNDLWRGQLDARFQGWLDEHVTFPISLCDRIVPGGRGCITEEKLIEFWRRLGYRDECLITAEPFKMWVIEDHFAGARPDFERIGVKLASESTVKAYEDMKLQVLNGAHTSMVHAGCLLGIKYIKDTIVHPLIKPYIKSVVFDEVAPFLNVPGADVMQFGRDVILRFSNRQLEHTNYQVAMYGTEKVKDRLVPSIIRYIEKTGRVPKGLAFAIAILLRYVTGYTEGKGVDTRGNEVEGILGINEKGETYLIDDPRADTISRKLRLSLSKLEAEPILDEILRDKSMFPFNSKITATKVLSELFQTIKGYYHQTKEQGLASALEGGLGNM